MSLIFAGSGTTGRVCIEEQEHSLLVDSDDELDRYLAKHIGHAASGMFVPEYRLLKNTDIEVVLEAAVTDQSAIVGQ
ncbi:MAG: hypothetical protein R3E76_04675 [Planctomycetota bacterium]